MKVNGGMPEHTYRNYEGRQCAVPYPAKGVLLGQCGDVTIFRIPKGLFAVVYGLQKTEYPDIGRAFQGFADCVHHQANTAGLLG